MAKKIEPTVVYDEINEVIDAQIEVLEWKEPEELAPLRARPDYIAKVFLKRWFAVGLFLVGSFVTLVASGMLSIDALFVALEKATNNGEGPILECDINTLFSCSTVAADPISTLIHLGDKPVPNAFLGLIFESVFVTIAVALLFGARFPKWFMTASMLGNVGTVAFTLWLSYQSMFHIHALCPWCMALLYGTSIQFIAQLNWNIVEGNLLGLRRTTQVKLVGIAKAGYVWLIGIFVIIAMALFETVWALEAMRVISF